MTSEQKPGIPDEQMVSGLTFTATCSAICCVVFVLLGIWFVDVRWFYTSGIAFLVFVGSATAAEMIGCK